MRPEIGQVTPPLDILSPVRVRSPVLTTSQSRFRPDALTNRSPERSVSHHAGRAFMRIYAQCRRLSAGQ